MKMKLLLSTFLFGMMINLSVTTKAQAVNITDSLALVDLYNSTNGPDWELHDNWLTGPVITWYGIGVVAGRVTAIDLEGDNLTGPLPASIGNLTNLSNLAIIYNNLTGSIPASIGNLDNLIFLYLYNNHLSGTIPSSIGNLINNLFDVELSNNQLTGPIPVSFNNLKSLQILDLDGNQLSGTLPASLNKIRKLTILNLQHNTFSGNLPDISNLRRLTSFNASYNNLSQGFNINYKDTLINLNLDVSNNRFTFNGLEFIAKNLPNATYAPQAPLTIHQHGSLLAVYAGGTLSKNTYRWYKVGGVSSTTITGDSTFQPSVSGSYYATVTNLKARKLTLTTDTLAYTAAPFTSQPVAFKLSIYPNPVRGVLTINGLNAHANSNITIADASGYVWITATVQQQSGAEYNISRLKAGYYMLNVSNGTTVSTVSFMKE